MGNVLRILKRDLLRLLKAPAALIVVGALLVLPSLYTWYNVVAFWNPYEATGNLKVCVVNQDAGTEHELTGKLNVGDTVAEELLANDKLDFVAEEYDTAMEDLKSGVVYAVYVIPDDFSECLISPLTGQLKSPQIKYYVNEKLGPVSPKITDTAANTLDQTINSMFVATVSDAAVKAVDKAVNDAEAKMSSARSKASERMQEANAAIDEVRVDLAKIKTAATNAQEMADSAGAAMTDAYALTADAQAAISDISAEASAVQNSLTAIASGSLSSLSGILADVSQVTMQASSAADGLVAKTSTAESRVDLAISKLQPVIDAVTDVSADLQTVADALSDSDPAKAKLVAISQDMANRSAVLQTFADDVQALKDRIAIASQAASEAAASLKTTAQGAAEALQTYSNSLYGKAAPAINSSLAQVSVACERLSSATSNLDTTIQQSQASLAQLSGLLGDCANAVAQTDALIAGFQGELAIISGDANMLAQSGAIADILANGTLNSESISSFMAAPTELSTEEFYAPNAYGSAMAPLFMNLTFWIGAFMLIIIFKLEVDDEGVKTVTPSQRYLSRFLLFSGMAVIQALVCCAGVLFLGVKAANVPALFLASAVASLAYLSIIYALSTTLHHLGKALCIVLVFAQIPGGSGLYPLELTDKFFQTIYPFLPFSYGIGAMREAIGGFYGNYYVYDLVALALFFVVMLILGAVLAPRISNVVRMASWQIREGDLYNGEEALVPARPFLLSQVARALSDRKDYRDVLERRYNRFSKLYPIFIRVSIVLGVGVPVILMLLLGFNAGEKVVLLTLFLLWFVCLFLFLIVVEAQRYSFERQLNIQRMSNENLMKVFFQRNRNISTNPNASKKTSDSATEEVDDA